ncbi:MAG: hypothetical protein D3908_07845 [Candidatus Electrothrix sp. AUS4]|nr:hypothetical protein [Candidatus Electrothrix sp. AUS4]
MRPRIHHGSGNHGPAGPSPAQQIRSAQRTTGTYLAHRAQNNRIARRLTELLGSSDDLPLIDTVERIQGAERDVILFGFTCSDPDQVMGEFLNNPNRFNVAITRARHKLIVVGSETFFTAIAQNEESLRANVCFKEFFEEHPSVDGADLSEQIIKQYND